MNFDTTIIGNDGIKYALYTRVYSIENVQSIRIYYLFVTVHKPVWKEMISADSLALRYCVNTDEYLTIGELKGVCSMLYHDIIQRLDEAFGIS